jgi:uncharacterized membrane protein
VTRRVLLLRVVGARPRLFISAGIGAATALALGPLTHCAFATRFLVGWDVGVGLYLALVAQVMARSDTARMRSRAAEEDEGQLVMLVLTVAAAVASLGAIVAELGSAAGAAGRQPAALALAVVTIVLSWFFIHSIFAVHYAHEFYGDAADGGGGMAFPGGDEEPDYWDFVYFAFVIGMTSQVSDVGVTTKAIRRTVAVHGVLSFAFNTALLALTVNIAASVI